MSKQEIRLIKFEIQQGDMAFHEIELWPRWIDFDWDAKLDDYLRNYYGYAPNTSFKDDPDEDGYYHLGGEIYIEVGSQQVVKPEELEVLKKYMYVNHYVE